MINFIIFLAKRFLFIKLMLQKLVTKFELEFPRDLLDERKKTELECKNNLALLNSGKIQPRIYKQPEI